MTTPSTTFSADASFGGDQAEAIAASEARLAAVAGEIRALLRRDLAGYVDRELRRRFVGRPEVSAGLSEAETRALRGRAAEASAVFLEGFDEALSSQVPWRAPLLADGGPQAAFEPGKDLRALTEVWDVVCGVDTVVETLAQSAGLGGDDRDPPGYQPPMRFIDGAYLPSLVENHGRVIVELRGLLEARAEADAVLQAEALAARWDAAAPDG